MKRRLVLLVAVLAIAGAIAAAPAVAARPPVVMVVLDEFPVGVLMLPSGKIDSRRFPGFAALARGSTWFRNAATVYDSTEKAVPAILDGRLPVAGGSPSYKTHRQSIFTVMDRLGYRIRSREEATTVCPPRLCPRRDHYGNPNYNILHDRRERLSQTIASLRRSKRPTFTFHHSVLPHVPWVYLPSGRARTGYPPGTLPDFATANGFYNPFLTQFNEQRHLLQVGYVDREIGELVSRLKKTDQWRKALVVVTADHGISFQQSFALDVVDRRDVNERNVEDVAPVPLFVKRPGQARGRISGAYAQTADIVPTIAHLLRAPVGFPVDGAQAFGRTVAARDGVTIQRRDLSGTIYVPAKEMEARRRAQTLRRRALFGSGPWSGVYRIGPNQALLGRRAATLTRIRQGPVRASFAVPRSLARVRRSAKTVPTLASGTISGASAPADRDLALAVNGRIAAVGRSFKLEGDRREYFAMNVPESRLRNGRNTMALYEVVGDRKLIPL